MRHRSTSTLALFIMLLFSVAYNSAFAIAPGPSVPIGDNTIAKYCKNGTCSTGNSYPQHNATRGEHGIGNYTGGIDLSQSTLIGIQLSQACLTMIKNNITSSCLTYDKLIPFDTTNTFFSGQWTSFPYFHRLPPLVHDAYRFNLGKNTVMVDPDGDFTARARMIIVNADGFTWINLDDPINNTQRLNHVDRFVSGGCLGATVSPNLALINDTIQYLENGCTKSNYNDTQVVKRAEIPFDFVHSPWIHYQQWLKQAKTIVKDCIRHHCDIPKDANANW